MTRIRTAIVLTCSIAALTFGQGCSKKTEDAPPSSFSDHGIAAQGRLSHYVQSAVVSQKLRDCWGRIQGEGAVAMDLVFRKAGSNWEIDKVSVTKSTVAKGQETIAQQCLEESTRGTSFPVEVGEAVEKASTQFYARLSWSVPLPAAGTDMTTEQVARMMGSGSGGLGDVAGCSECVSRTEYPYGLKCESRKSGGHLDCKENSTNVCSTASTTCLRGVFTGSGGVIMY